MSFTLKESVAAEVRAQLARARETQEELAKAVGVSPATIGRRLAGESPFDLDELERAAKFLGVSVESLMGVRLSA